MSIPLLALLAGVSPIAIVASPVQAPTAGQPQSPAQTQPAAPANSPEAAAQNPATSGAGFTYFFTATGSAFEAYFQQNAKMGDDGNKLVTVKLMKFSPTFRSWISSNFPGGETADYAIDTYSIDCEAKKVGEHQITWYDNSGTELTDYDFGGALSAPIPYSMKDNLMKKVCGLQ